MGEEFLLARVVQGINKAFTAVSGEEILEIKVRYIKSRRGVKYKTIAKWLGTQMPF